MVKKIICVAAAVLCAVTAAPLSVSAIEAGTYEELRKLSAELEAEQFPDPEAKFTEVTEGDFTFRLYDEFALLSDCTNTDITAAEIPAAVQDLPVVGCVENPFRFCRKLTSLSLPDGFTHFRWERLIDTMSVILGSTEETVPTIKEIIVSESNPDFTVWNGLLCSKDLKTVIGCPPALDNKELLLPEETDTIREYAFFACLALEKAVIPETVQHIHCNAFTSCLNLQYAELPESITSISGDMFLDCEKLSEVVLRGAVQTIGYGAFNCCKALKDFQIPETVTQVGWKAFDDCGCFENADGLHYVQNWLVGCDEGTAAVQVRKGTEGIAEMALFTISDAESIEVPATVRYMGARCISPVAGSASAVLHFRAAQIPELAVISAKSFTDIYIYDPGCTIFDSEKTIPASYKLLNPDGVIVISDADTQPEKYRTGDVVIHGYAGSTAAAYAEKYARKFEAIPPNGDVNADGVTQIADLVLMQKYLLGDADTVLTDWKAGDLNSDDKLTAVDMSLLKQILLAQ